MRLMLACCVLFMAACSSPSEPPKPALTYPATTMGNVVDDYDGTKVADPIAGWKTSTARRWPPGSPRRTP